jgi:hypothetical protein
LQVNVFAERESKIMSTSAINFSVKTDFGDTIAVDGYTRDFNTIAAPVSLITPADLKNLEINDPSQVQFLHHSRTSFSA